MTSSISPQSLLDRQQRRVVIESGEGVYLIDSSGKRYLDAVGGSHVVTIGHGVDELAAAIEKQTRKVAFVGTRHFVSQAALDLASVVTDMAPEGLDTAYFVTSGADGVEMALQLSYQFHCSRGNSSKRIFVGHERSYHGATIGALSLGGRQQIRSQLQPYIFETRRIPSPHCARCPLGLSYPSCDLKCADQLAEVIATEGSEQINAFIGEPISGTTGGAIVPPPGYYERIRKICDEQDVLFIADEIITGFGRTGRPFGIMNWDAVPDIIISGKGLASGYAPLSAVVIHSRLIDPIVAINGEITFRSTFSGHPAACAAALAVQQYVGAHDLESRCRVTGSYLVSRLKAMAERSQFVSEVRGQGLLLAVELVKDKSTRNNYSRSNHIFERVVESALARGLVIVGGSGTASTSDGDFILVSPPFTISESECDLLVSLLEQSISTVCRSAA